MVMYITSVIRKPLYLTHFVAKLIALELIALELIALELTALELIALELITLEGNPCLQYLFH